MRVLNRVVFFIGWLLSPLTTWNDVFINIPLAYIFASLFFEIFPVSFTTLVVIFYWLSNGLGILLMYIAGHNVITKERLSVRSILITLLTYTIALFLIDKFVTLRPI